MIRLTFWVVSALALALAAASAGVVVDLVDVDVEVRSGGGCGRDGDGDENENGRDAAAAAGLAVGTRLAAARVVTVAAVLLSGCSMVGEGLGWVTGGCDGCPRCEGDLGWHSVLILACQRSIWWCFLTFSRFVDQHRGSVLIFPFRCEPLT